MLSNVAGIIVCTWGWVRLRSTGKGKITQPLARHVQERPLPSLSRVRAGNKYMSLDINLYFERKSKWKGKLEDSKGTKVHSHEQIELA